MHTCYSLHHAQGERQLASQSTSELYLWAMQPLEINLLNTTSTSRLSGYMLSCVLQVSVYTYGAPRAGNHRFARDYERVVPDTWHVINDQVGKAGQRPPGVSDASRSMSPLAHDCCSACGAMCTCLD